MAKGLSLHIGLNQIDPNHYADWDGKLNAAERDAKDMAKLLKEYQPVFQSKILLGPNSEGHAVANKSTVVSEIEYAASVLQRNDLFVITYSGHGGLLPNLNSDPEDEDSDQTWCLYDEQLVDDELVNLWVKFNEGVRIVVISDSCHSGTIIKINRRFKPGTQAFCPKYTPDDISYKTYIRNQSLYDKILKASFTDISDIQASIISISACQDNQFAYDGDYNSVFTACLKTTWAFGAFNGNYRSFHQEIDSCLSLKNPRQDPNYKDLGRPDQIFNNQKPFKV